MVAGSQPQSFKSLNSRPLDNCISNKLSGVAGVAGLEAMLGEPPCYSSLGTLGLHVKNNIKLLG